MNLFKSRQRVADHGEVFTPPWMVEGMLDLIKDETERIDSRFLESACGSGNFLTQILRRKLASVDRKFGKCWTSASINGSFALRSELESTNYFCCAASVNGQTD